MDGQSNVSIKPSIHQEIKGIKYNCLIAFVAKGPTLYSNQRVTVYFTFRDLPC